MSVTSVRLTEEESGLIRSYCSLHGISMSDALKRALLEKIEDEFDLAEYEAAKKRYEDNPLVTPSRKPAGSLDSNEKMGNSF